MDRRVREPGLVPVDGLREGRDRRELRRDRDRRVGGPGRQVPQGRDLGREMGRMDPADISSASGRELVERGGRKAACLWGIGLPGATNGRSSVEDADGLKGSLFDQGVCGDGSGWTGADHSYSLGFNRRHT